LRQFLAAFWCPAAFERTSPAKPARQFWELLRIARMDFAVEEFFRSRFDATYCAVLIWISLSDRIIAPMEAPERIREKRG